eukprot:TRINITY_DN1280_c0_g2_i19.p1 TRINITY_DN1280_c0_g2~~TRINITY_DN1280_c0_g2_i19.p1  ORF type:complete len:365 (-),score=24.98 TRINITY_DN1280_c0_g2_i19:818-1912(-)
MILAAGQGTRVRPLTKSIPKPMIPILGKPVMEYLIEHLARYGVREIMVNVSHHHDHIERYFGDGHRWGVAIGYSYEGVRDHGDIVPRPLGSAGGMRNIQDFSGFFDTTTLVICGDAIIDLDLGAALEEHRRKRALASVVALNVSRDLVASYGIVVPDREGQILCFQEKPRIDEALSTLASTGIYLFEPEVLDLIPKSTVFDIGSQLFPLLVEKGLPFFVQQHNFNWIDIGNIVDYWAVLQRVLRGEVALMDMPGREVKPGIWAGLNTSIAWDEVDIVGPVYIGSGVRIDPGASILGPAWIGHGCHLRPGARVERSILFEYTRIAENQCFVDTVMSPMYCVDSRGEAEYSGDDACPLRWGDARGS